MSVQCETVAKQAAGAQMGLFERYLSLWVLVCIVAGIALVASIKPFMHQPAVIAAASHQ